MNNQEQIRETLKKEKFPFDKLKNQISKEVFNSLNHKTPMGGYNVSIDDYEDILNQNWNMYNIGKRIAFVGTDDNPDIYEMSRHILDFNIQYRFKKNVEISLAANDLINQPFLFLQDGNRDKKWNRKSDQVFQKYQPGQTISLGVKYNF